MDQLPVRGMAEHRPDPPTGMTGFGCAAAGLQRTCPQLAGQDLGTRQPTGLFCREEGEPTMLRVTAVGIVVALLARAVWAGESPTPNEVANSPEALKAEIEALQAAKVA